MKKKVIVSGIIFIVLITLIFSFGIIRSNIEISDLKDNLISRSDLKNV